MASAVTRSAVPAESMTCSFDAVDAAGKRCSGRTAASQVGAEHLDPMFAACATGARTTTGTRWLCGTATERVEIVRDGTGRVQDLPPRRSSCPGAAASRDAQPPDQCHNRIGERVPDVPVGLTNSTNGPPFTAKAEGQAATDDSNAKLLPTQRRRTSPPGSDDRGSPAHGAKLR